MRLKDGLPSLRDHRTHEVLKRCFAAGSDRFGFRLVLYSVQHNHLHLICEADDREALSKGVHALQIRMARALNRHWGRKGSVFDGRYYDHVLRSPGEVRASVLYTLQNCRKHGIHHSCPDPFSSAPWFDAWLEDVEFVGMGTVRPVVPASTWLLKEAWKKHGLIGVVENPGRRRRRRRA